MVKARRNTEGETSFVLREIPRELWRQVKSRAALEGVPVRTILLSLLEAYVAHVNGKKERG